jgi:hypothetical protein
MAPAPPECLTWGRRPLAAALHRFGPGDPIPEHAAGYWKAAGEAHHALTAHSSPWRLLGTARSLRSLLSAGEP